MPKHIDTAAWRARSAAQASALAALSSTPSPKTIVYGETTAVAHIWCRRNGISPFARDTVIVTSHRCGRGCAIEADDRVVFVGAVATRPDYREVLGALLPALKNVGGLGKIESAVWRGRSSRVELTESTCNHVEQHRHETAVGDIESSHPLMTAIAAVLEEELAHEGLANPSGAARVIAVELLNRVFSPASSTTCKHVEQRRHETAVGDIYVCLGCLECSVGQSLEAVIDGVQRYVVVTNFRPMAVAWAQHRHLAGDQVVVFDTHHLPNSAHGLSPRTHELVLLDDWHEGYYALTTELALKAAGFDVPPHPRGRHEVEPMESKLDERWVDRDLDRWSEAVERAQDADHEEFLDATGQPFGGRGYEAEDGS